MASHSFHPDVREHGLADGCDRCAELAAHPMHLDPPNFAAAWERMLRVHWSHRYPDEPVPEPRTENEARLVGLLYTWAVFLERYTTTDPHDVPLLVMGVA